jgi:predicted nuclease of restriction endonuclease-like (RecB) superfamily
MSENRKKEITSTPTQYQSLYADIKQLITQARSSVVKQVNQTLTVTYWQIGKRISIDILDSNRADYGKQVLPKLSQQLSDEFGKGFTYSSLTRMVKFYKAFPEQTIIATLSQQLSWSHFVELLKLEDVIQREFYAHMSHHESWSVRTLRERMDGMLFERSAIAKQPEKVIRQELAKLEQPQTASLALHLKDPYLLDFLELQDNFSEKDLENAILHKLEHFILELGSDFAFMARQKRLQIGGNDYYLDLLFYHRKLKRLVLIELKLGEFKPEYKGQVELYLKWLAKYEQQPDENSPIAILLCSSKDKEVVELMELEQDDIHIAEYWLQLPPKEVLQAKLHKAIEEATLRLGFGDE